MNRGSLPSPLEIKQGFQIIAQDGDYKIPKGVMAQIRKLIIQSSKAIVEKQCAVRKES